ncbi:MAG: M23 family metallopeptidase [Nitrospirales bacterium]|nr:M23 family metallopeptidase [Nitrospira sp.]MDR4501258.1 M23 family metallopeptidase [Nitrospirales bacterium]
MKGSEESYSIIVFRGARSNPIRLKLGKATVRYSLIAGLCLLVLQSGILAHYVYQRSQLSELAGLRQELATSRERTSVFGTEVEGMKKRMVSLEHLNRKLQTMFGLDPDEIEGVPNSVPGQGGEEFPYEDSILSAEGRAQVGEVKAVTGTKKIHASTMHEKIREIEMGLRWIDAQSQVEKKILDTLLNTANLRAERWAATPSIWPVKGPITSKFGPRVSPFTGKKALHAGIDIGSPRGTEVRAPSSGKVVIAAYDARMGKFIRIDHGFGIETTYGHLSKMQVKYGQKVKRGDLIGLVGSTGKFSTGPHLHYQVAVNDRVVDPVQYILD